MKKIFCLLFFAMTLSFVYSQSEPILKIGLIADPQYQDKPSMTPPNSGERNYRGGLWKTEEAVKTFNYLDVDFVMTLGDVIDGELRSLDSIMPIYNNLKPQIDAYFVLGNHDYDVEDQSQLLDKLFMPDYYYSYVRKGWRFIALNTSDYSFYANPLHQHDIEVVEAYSKSVEDKPNHFEWNGAIGEEQQKWLKRELKLAEELDQKVILFAHIPLRPLDDIHGVWNNQEIIDIIEDSPNVVAYINGHNHYGDYVKKNGVHYITMNGMIGNPHRNSYAILEIFEDNSLNLKAFGVQAEIVLD